MDNNELQRILDRITGRGAIVAAALAGKYYARFAKYLESSHDQSPLSILAAARRILRDFEPSLADTLSTTQMAAWIVGNKQVSQVVPVSSLTIISKTAKPSDLILESSRYIDFPWIESATKSLIKRGIMLPDDYYRADAKIKQQSFTISGDVTERAIERVRDIIAEQVRKGASYKEFKKAAEVDLSDSFLYPGHVETVFRTNVQTAYSDGRETAANNPIIDELFPYQEYYATHDARTRHDHIALETLGIDGTNVFRRDDPVWDYFTPPWDYNCRCTVNLLTVEAAARRGVKEAQAWLRSGAPPRNPTYCIDKIKFRPKPGFGGRVKSYA